MSETVQARAVELVCGYCDPRATCGVCRLYQSIKTLEYHMEGVAIEQAAERAEYDGRKAVRAANRLRDSGRKTGGGESPDAATERDDRDQIRENGADADR